MSAIQKKRILLVNDEPEILTLVTTRLKQRGYQVLAASDGLEGLEKAKKQRPDLILVDISMPRMNGLQMVQLLREYKELKETPVVVLTASSQPDEAAWRKQVGVNQIILKPFETGELLQEVEAALYGQTRRKVA